MFRLLFKCFVWIYRNTDIINLFTHWADVKRNWSSFKLYAQGNEINQKKSKYACVHWTLYLRSIWTNEHVLYENWTKYNNNKLIAKWYASCDCAYNTRHCELWTICMHCEIVCLPVRYVHCSETVWQSSEWAPLIAKRLGKSDDLGKCRKACGCVLRPHKKTQIRRHFYLLHEVIHGSVCNRSVDCEYAKMNIFFPF